jgi:hypothetical protein
MEPTFFFPLVLLLMMTSSPLKPWFSQTDNLWQKQITYSKLMCNIWENHSFPALPESNDPSLSSSRTTYMNRHKREVYPVPKKELPTQHHVNLTCDHRFQISNDTRKYPAVPSQYHVNQTCNHCFQISNGAREYPAPASTTARAINSSVKLKNI